MEKESFEQMRLKQIDIYVHEKKKNESRDTPYICHKINSKWIMDLNVNHKTCKRKIRKI